ncbi:glycosyltransferase [Pararhodobacter sp. CCB-MM2]|uniref:glycosyltransferase n=1 Tax=Pararhodobacter sp. CCB-MM2 TaxID=1786003 RepID=UPI0008309117|nr:glycosyltransferase [Pararhodobacter sp. CCB-MM2]
MALKDFLERRKASRGAHVIGLCRFSYPALGGFKNEHDTPEDRARYLYAPERLDERFRLFEAFTLPSLRTQTDQDFTFLIVVGEDFPPDRMEQLRALTADLPQVVIVPRAPGRHREVMSEVIEQFRVPDSFSIQFRLDDDDAMGVGFVHKCRRILDQNYQLFEGSRHVAIDFTRGWNALPSAEGIRAARQKALYLGVSFAIAFRPDTKLSVMNFTHHEVWQHMPTITRTDPDMWVRGVNAHNDSGDRINEGLRRLTEEEEQKFERAFGITMEHVRAVYAR